MHSTKTITLAPLNIIYGGCDKERLTWAPIYRWDTNNRKPSLPDVRVNLEARALITSTACRLQAPFTNVHHSRIGRATYTPLSVCVPKMKLWSCGANAPPCSIVYYPTTFMKRSCEGSHLRRLLSTWFPHEMLRQRKFVAFNYLHDAELGIVVIDWPIVVVVLIFYTQHWNCIQALYVRTVYERSQLCAIFFPREFFLPLIFHEAKLRSMGPMRALVD